MTSWGWYKFNLSTARELYGDLNVTRAYFCIYADWTDLGSSPSDWSIQSIDASNETWDDSSITWNNKPTRTGGIANSSTLTSSTGWLIFTLNATSVIQVPYDASLTKTVVMDTLETEYYAEFETNEGTNRPRLYVYYEKDYDQDPTTPEPYIESPLSYQFTYYVKMDSVTSSRNTTANYGDYNFSQVAYRSDAGVDLDLFYSFNLSTPDLVNGQANTVKYLTNATTFDFNSIRLYAYCKFVSDPSISPEYLGFNRLMGVYRSNETWSEMGVTYNNRPLFRDTVGLAQKIDRAGWFSWSLLDDEDFMRFSIQNGYNYTVANSVDETMSPIAFSDWYCREFGSFTTKIVADVWIEDLVIEVPTDSLTFYNAHILFAKNLGIDNTIGYFIAGTFLSVALFLVTIVPIAWVTKKRLAVMVLLFGEMVIFTFFGWLHVGLLVLAIIALLVFSKKGVLS